MRSFRAGTPRASWAAVTAMSMAAWTSASLAGGGQAAAPDQTDRERSRKGLNTEAALLSRVSPPLLVRAFGAELGPDRPHLVLEFVEGPRLSTLIRRDGVIVEQALPLALNLCSVSTICPSRESCTSTSSREHHHGRLPRLIDLSVARPISELGSLSDRVGTDAYMSPEQCDPAALARSARPATYGAGRNRPRGLYGRAPLPATQHRSGLSPAHLEAADG